MNVFFKRRFLSGIVIIMLLIASCSEDENYAVFDVSCSENVEIGFKGKVLEIPIKASSDVKVYTSSSWITFQLKHDVERTADGLLTLTIGKNLTGDYRETVVRIGMQGSSEYQIRIRQESSANVLNDLKLETSLNPLKEAIKFAFEESTSTYTAKYLYWIASERPEYLIPTFSSNGKVFLNGNEIISGQTKISFAEDLPIKVEMPSGDIYEFTISLNCPQINRELPVLHMKPERLIADKDNYVDTYIELFDKTAQSTGEGWWNSATQGMVEMRGRGNSTWILPKKPYRLKFPEKYSPIGLNHATAKSWTLLAQDMDKSLLRTHLAFEYSRFLFNESEDYHHEKAILFTPCSRYVNVYLTGYYYDSSNGRTTYKNGEYLGVYQMSDQVERDNGRIAVEKLEEKDGDDPEKITGGYILETDVHDGDHFTSLKNVKLSYKYPKDDDYAPAQYDYITSFLNAMETALFGDKFQDENEGWRKYLDIKTLADFIIIKELVADMDGYTSTYLYKRRGYDKLFFGPIWDCDKGWDNEKRTSSQYPVDRNLMIHAGFGLPGCNGEDWYERLWKDEDLRRFVAARWASKKDELLALTEKVLAEVPTSMPKAIDANFSIWEFYFQASSEAKMPAKTYAEEIERIRELTRERAVLLDKLF